VPLCPNYRIRLFLSVDLVGSTAFKAGAGGNMDEDVQSPFPIWVNRIGHFYREFPKQLSREFERRAEADHPDSRDHIPNVWKTIGDEIIFCVRLQSTEHLALCVDAFLRTLEQYGDDLEKAEIPLDVKGAAWVGAFPTPNITVPVSDIYSEPTEAAPGLETDEEMEALAEKEPSRYDFLGKDIDTGFRVAKYSGSDRLALSVELAYLLASVCAEGKQNFRFSYSGRDTMKGVIGGRPYPLVWIDTERKYSRREVRALERAMTGEKEVDHHLLRNFLEAFMCDEELLKPFLLGHGSTISTPDLPAIYLAFKDAWHAQAKENEQRELVESESVGEGTAQTAAAEVGEPDEQSLRAIEENIKQILSRFESD
jgi:hypothetical protein